MLSPARAAAFAAEKPSTQSRDGELRVSALRGTERNAAKESENLADAAGHFRQRLPDAAGSWFAWENVSRVLSFGFVSDLHED
jgi:hypothetical protein